VIAEALDEFAGEQNVDLQVWVNDLQSGLYPRPASSHERLADAAEHRLRRSPDEMGEQLRGR